MIYRLITAKSAEELSEKVTEVLNDPGSFGPLGPPTASPTGGGVVYAQAVISKIGDRRSKKTSVSKSKSA